MWTETFEERHKLGLEPLSDGKNVTRYYYYTHERPCDEGYEYDVYEFPAGTTERSAMLALIDEYDKSDAVNSFTLNGRKTWLPLEKRKSMRQSIIALQAMGVSEFTYWLGLMPITMPMSRFEQLLNVLEIYALRCFNVTAQHMARVMSLPMDQIPTYDYTIDYPDHLDITV